MRGAFLYHIPTFDALVEMGTNAKANICGCGDVIFEEKMSSETHKCRSQSVLNVLELGASLLSVSTMDLKRVFKDIRK